MTQSPSGAALRSGRREAGRNLRRSVCVLGAAGDTTNLGVDALLESILVGFARTLPGVDVTVFDNGLGLRAGRLPTATGDIAFDLLGIRSSRRVWRPESLANMAMSARVGLRHNIGVRRLRDADVVVDISGGDSFSDIYGAERFKAIAGQKAVALSTGTPLILLPQTYGPFSGARTRVAAADLVRRSAMAWARDTASFAVLRDLLGGDVDARRHRQGVDVAFALPQRQPSALDPTIGSWLSSGDHVFGLNVSGLLANDDASQADFGLRSNYAHLVQRVARRVLDQTDARVLLVPHVLSDLWVVESDVAASRRLAATLAAEHPDRVAVLEGIDQAQEVKWVIGRCTAFCGTRMHSTIAALSSHTPALALAYSPKTQGVFDSCGQGHRVADLRTHGVDSVEAQVMDLWRTRNRVANQLAAAVPAVVRQSTAPFEAIATMVTGGQPGTSRDGMSRHRDE